MNMQKFLKIIMDIQKNVDDYYKKMILLFDIDWQGHNNYQI